MDVKYHGVDASYLTHVEEAGGKLQENGVVKPAPEIFMENGVNMVRLRLFDKPIYENGASSLEYTLQLADRFHKKGMKILLAIHYSWTWADPEYQRIPKDWEGQSFDELTVTVRDYTEEVLTAFMNRGITPELIQLGNEITTGFLYPYGRVGDDDHSLGGGPTEQVYNTPEQWAQFRTLMRQAMKATRSVAPDSRTILHHSRSGDNAACRWFFDLLLKDNDIDFDIIGVSYYNWWSGNGPLSKFRANVRDLSLRYEKDIMLLETAYPWTLDEAVYSASDESINGDSEIENIVEHEYHLLPFYPATPEGQWSYMLTLRSIIAGIPLGRGLGIIYWETSWIAAPARAPDYLCKWENLALFDEKGEALPAFAALGDKVSFPR